ncbi:MAG: hypothetical protein JOZ86_11380 [Candidatus Eremiobacteraeota bacterium]|nr:hypothetical protein [Candidatus Eremiobacteraeota bacterium]
MYYLALYDANAPSSGWSKTIALGTLNGNTLQFSASGATLGAQVYGIVLYEVLPPSGTWTFTGKDTSGAALTLNGTLPNIALTNAQYGTVNVQYAFGATTSNFNCPSTFIGPAPFSPITSFTVNRTSTSCSYVATDPFGRTQTERITNSAPLLSPVAGTVTGSWSADASGCSAYSGVFCNGEWSGSGAFPTVTVSQTTGDPFTHVLVVLAGSAPLGMVTYSLNGTCGQNLGGYIHGGGPLPVPNSYPVAFDVSSSGPVCTVRVTDVADGIFQDVQITAN